MKTKASEIARAGINEQILPYIVQDIANLIGLEKTLRLVEHYGGRRVFVPATFKPEHPLTHLIGAEACAKLIAYYAGENIEIPRCYKALCAIRNAKICDSEKSQSKLAVEYNLTQRHIRNIQKKYRKQDDRQSDLF